MYSDHDITICHHDEVLSYIATGYEQHYSIVNSVKHNALTLLACEMTQYLATYFRWLTY